MPYTRRRDQERRRIHRTRRHNISNKDGVLNMTIRDIERRIATLEQAGKGNGVPEIVIYSEHGELIKGNPEANNRIVLTSADCGQKVA